MNNESRNMFNFIIKYKKSGSIKSARKKKRDEARMRIKRKPIQRMKEEYKLGRNKYVMVREVEK